MDFPLETAQLTIYRHSATHPDASYWMPVSPAASAFNLTAGSDLNNKRLNSDSYNTSIERMHDTYSCRAVARYATDKK